MIARGRATAPAAAPHSGPAWLGLLAGTAVFVVTFGFRYLSYSGFPNDHFVHLSRAQQMLFGQWPVRDFVDPGMPLMYLTSAVGLLASGHNLFGEALIAFGAIALAGALTFEAARAAAGSTLVGLAAAVVQAASYPRSYSYPKLLLYAAAILLCWRCVANPTRRRCAALGLWVAVAFLFRHDHGVFIGVAALLSVTLARGTLAARATGAAALTAGAAFLLVPWMIFVQATLGLPAYVRSAVEFSRVEAVQTGLVRPRFRIDSVAGLWTRDDAPEERALIHVRWVPGLSPEEQERRERVLGLQVVQQHDGRTWRYTVERSSARVRALQGDPAVEDTAGLERVQPGWGEQLAGLFSPLRGHPGPGLPIGSNSEALLYYTMLGLPVAGIVAAVWRRRAAAPMPDAGVRLAVVALLALCTGATFLRDPLRERFADAIVPAAVLGAWLVAAAWRGAQIMPRAVRNGMRTAVLVLTCVLVASVVVLGSTHEQIDRIGPVTTDALTARAAAVTRALQHEYDSSFLPSPTAFALRPAFAWLEACTLPSDRFSYVGFAPDAYFLAHRGFAGGQVAFIGEYYSSPGEQVLTLERFRRERVPLILMPEDNAAEFRRRFPLLGEYVTTNFVRVGTLELSGDDEAQVLMDRRLAPARKYQPLGWPCFR